MNATVVMAADSPTRLAEPHLVTDTAVIADTLAHLKFAMPSNVVNATVAVAADFPTRPTAPTPTSPVTADQPVFATPSNVVSAIVEVLADSLTPVRVVLEPVAEEVFASSSRRANVIVVTHAASVTKPLTPTKCFQYCALINQ